MAAKSIAREDLDHILAHTHEVWHPLRDQRLFVTGGTGFFGHWLLESLLHANRELSLNARATVLTRNPEAFAAKAPHIAADPAVSLLEGDVRTFAFPAEHHGFILHAAADSGGRQAHCPAYELAESILEGTRHVLQFARETKAKRLLFTSTGAVYGRSANIPHIPEEFPAAPDPLALASSYDEAKRMAEHLCVAYSHDTQLECAIARCFAFVGPHLPLDAHFAIGNFIGSALAGKPIHVHGDGTPLRSWLYTADLAIWLWTMLVRAPKNRAYNVGSEDAHTIADAARLTARTLHPGLKIQIDGTPQRHAPLNSFVPSTERARTELKLQQHISLEEALRRTAAWHGHTVPAQKTKDKG